MLAALGVIVIEIQPDNPTHFTNIVVALEEKSGERGTKVIERALC